MQLGGRLAMVRTDSEIDNSVTWSHQGKAHQLPVSLDDFRDALSVLGLGLVVHR